jgi:NADH-quinone oxidoreductase subunit C
MSAKLDRLCETLSAVFGDRISKTINALGEVTIEVAAKDYLAVAQSLRDHPELRFEQLIDLCGVDYLGHVGWESKRYAAVSHLLSIANNVRLRLRAFADDAEFPVLASIVDVWNVANWYEREAFDLYGIHFERHPDLRRILTDYGFVGHPFRKDFPISGYVEMRYDDEQKRVVYQPVSIEPREVTPRIVREENYGGVGRG